MIEIGIVLAAYYIFIGIMVFVTFIYKGDDLNHVLSYSIFWIIYLIIIIIKSFILAIKCLINDISNII